MRFFQNDLTAKILFALYIVLFIVCAIRPYDRVDWWAENIPLMIVVAVLVVLYAKGIRFSPLSYVLMSVLLYLHTIGGHYTFERVPFSFVTDTFGFARNHYDRIAHFTVGFYAYPIAELLLARRLTRSKTILFLFPVFAIAFVAMGYELIEWVFAATNGGSAGAAFLGSQGDIWDAQKDMLADTLGGLAATGLFFWRKRGALRGGASFRTGYGIVKGSKK